MDSVVNGDISEDCKDKESDLAAKENCEPSLSVPENNSKLVSELSPSKDVSNDPFNDNLTHNTSKTDEKIPQQNSSDDNLMDQTEDNVSKPNHSANDIDSSLSVISQKETSVNDNNATSKESFSSETQENDVTSGSEEKSDSNCNEKPHKPLTTTQPDENSLNLSVSSSDAKNAACEEPIKLAKSKEDADGCDSSLDSAVSTKTAENGSVPCDNKQSKDSVSKSPLDVSSCKDLTEKILDSISNSLDMPSTNIDNKPNDTLNNSDSESSKINSTAVEKVEKNESSPLEQLDQHLKSIDSTIDEATNHCESKEKTHDDTAKIDSSKTDQKDAADNRLKESDSFVFTDISKEETGFPNVFTGLVVIGKYISVKGDFTLRSSEALVESPSLIAPYLLKEPDTFPPRLDDSKYEQKDFFHSTAGEMLIGIGLSRVSEWFQRDMTRIKKRQMKKEGKSPELEENLKMHETFYNEARKANKIYSFNLKSCETCGFATESSIVMEGHLLVPHINPRREYQCSFCNVVNRDPKALLEHMYRVHAKTGRIQPPTLFFECPYCTFESNSKVKLSNHLMKCQRFYDPNRNQAPPKDFEFPALTPKPITVAVVKSYEKSMSSMQRGRGRPKKIDSIAEQLNNLNQYASNMNHSPLVPSHVPPYRPSSTSTLSENLSNMTNQMISSIQMPNMGLRSAHSNLGQIRPGLPPPMHLPSANRFFQVVNSSGPLMPMLSNTPLVSSASQFPYSTNLINTNSVSKKVSAPSPQFLNSLFGGSLRQQNPPKSVPEVTITPLPKLHGPYPVPVSKPSSKQSNNSSSPSSSLVVCEICDGYIKDLEQLRSHMQLIHKVKIHPKMLVSRPPLNCQKCQWRFFTDQGLERHLLGAHGLVTSNMQEQANKGKDAGCCTICGRVFASKLVSHMNQVHKLTLKPAHLSYKCTVCSATFNLYRLFENHVYLVHSGAAKRSAEGGSNSSKKLKSGSGDYIDSHFEGEPKNHTVKCSDCGNNFRKHGAQTDKCEKCLKCDVSQAAIKSKMS